MLAVTVDEFYGKTRGMVLGLPKRFFRSALCLRFKLFRRRTFDVLR